MNHHSVFVQVEVLLLAHELLVPHRTLGVEDGAGNSTVVDVAAHCLLHLKLHERVHRVVGDRAYPNQVCRNDWLARPGVSNSTSGLAHHTV